eukprot:GHVR01175568.1.p1 GENE.GHVR01175568.1~~GHVR01175568.1.p1  ORF type:complete len:291 (+),score=67.71 GHVR01175568.1:860-1732(+)
MSIREAKKKLYQNYVSMNKQLDLQVAKHQLAQFNEKLNLYIFINDCLTAGREVQFHVNALRIDLPPGLFEPTEKITKTEATILFKTLLKKVAEERAAERKKEEQRKKNEAMKTEVLTKMSPTDLFDRAAVQAVKKAIKADGGINYAAAFTGTVKEECVQVQPTTKRTKTKNNINEAKKAKNCKGSGEPTQQREKTKKEKEEEKKRQQPKAGAKSRAQPKGAAQDPKGRARAKARARTQTARAAGTRARVRATESARKEMAAAARLESPQAANSSKGDGVQRAGSGGDVLS